MKSLKAALQLDPHLCPFPQSYLPSFLSFCPLLQVLPDNDPCVRHWHKNSYQFCFWVKTHRSSNLLKVTQWWSGRAVFEGLSCTLTEKGLLNETRGMGLRKSTPGSGQAHPTASCWPPSVQGSHPLSTLTAAGSWWSVGLRWPACLVLFLVPFYSCGRMFQPESAWTASTLSALGMAVERGSLVFLHPLFNPWFWHECSALLPLRLSLFCFLIAFSSFKNFTLAYQKLWLSKVLFLIWDQELILEAEKLNTDSFSLCFNWLPSHSSSVGAIQGTEEKKSRHLYFQLLSCHSVWNMSHKARRIFHIRYVFFVFFFKFFCVKLLFI